MHAYHLQMEREEDARQLAQILQVDAVVVGVVTEYTPYYPPRLTMQVQWFTANPNFHPIPAGYGLPWGTAGEKDIPGPLIFQAELALAKEQLKTQSPPYEKLPPNPPPPMDRAERVCPIRRGHSSQPLQGPTGGKSTMFARSRMRRQFRRRRQPCSARDGAAPLTLTPGENGADFPPNWPDPHGFIPRPPTAHPMSGVPSDEPVMQHMKSYCGNDAEFTTALEDYYYSRDDARMGGWQNYLRRSDDFVRFCCRLHIWEMLSARGGAGETRVVWRWSPIR